MSKFAEILQPGIRLPLKILNCSGGIVISFKYTRAIYSSSLHKKLRILAPDINEIIKNVSLCNKRVIFVQHAHVQKMLKMLLGILARK